MRTASMPQPSIPASRPFSELMIFILSGLWRFAEPVVVLVAGLIFASAVLIAMGLVAILAASAKFTKVYFSLRAK